MGIPMKKKVIQDFSYRYSWFHLIRPLTLSGTISPILIGTLYATKKGNIEIQYFIVLLLASLLIQIATNIFNDYFDFKQGQDKQKWTKQQEPLRTPRHHQLPYVAIGLIVLASFLGLWLAFRTEAWILLVGVLGILFGISYSAGQYALAAIGLGEVVAAIFLGMATTILAYVVQGNSIDWNIIFLSLPFVFLIATMILTNNIRDIKKDTGFRSTIAILIGRKWAIRILVGLLLLAYSSVIGLVLFHIVPKLALIVLLALPCAVRLRFSFRKVPQPEIEMLGMKWAAYHHWTFGLLFALSFFISFL